MKKNNLKIRIGIIFRIHNSYITFCQLLSIKLLLKKMYLKRTANRAKIDGWSINYFLRYSNSSCRTFQYPNCTQQAKHQRKSCMFSQGLNHLYFILIDIIHIFQIGKYVQIYREHLHQIQTDQMFTLKSQIHKNVAMRLPQKVIFL